MWPLNFLKSASTGTFSCLKVATILLLPASMPAVPAAPATKAASSREPLTVIARDRAIALLLVCSGPTPGEHAPQRRVAVDEMMLQCRGAVQHHHPQQRPGQIGVDLAKDVRQLLILVHQIG